MTASARRQLICLWCGPVATLLFGLGFVVLAGFLPPPPPSPHTAIEEIARLYGDHVDRIRAGLLITCLAGGLLGPWVAAISTQLKRIEGPDSPLTYAQLGLGMVTLVVFTVVPMVLQAAIFRPDRDADALLALHDLFWITFVGIYAFPTIQCLAIAVCVMTDSRQTILPRWFGYFNAWVAVGFAPASTIYWFREGPFAWNGVFAWWIPVFVFFTWMAVNTAVIRRAILEQSLTDTRGEALIRKP